MQWIRRKILESAETKIKLARDSVFIAKLENAGQAIISALERGNKILIAGNGGSAADAQHFAAELSGKFEKLGRRGLPAVALSTNSSNLTAIGNDFGFDFVFSRQLESLAIDGDIVFGISTSGNSKNIIKMFEKAKELRLETVALLGNDGGKAKNIADHSLTIPNSKTPAIQEAHIMVIHIICGIIDKYF